MKTDEHRSVFIFTTSNVRILALSGGFFVVLRVFVSPVKIPAPLAIGKSVGAPLRGRLGRPHRAAPTVACRSVPPKQAWSSGFSLHGGRTARRLNSIPERHSRGEPQDHGNFVVRIGRTG